MGAAARQQRQDEAEEAKRGLENEARLQIQEGHLNAFFGCAPLSVPQMSSSHEERLTASFGHASLDEAQSSSSQEVHLSVSPEQARMNEMHSLNEPHSSFSGLLNDIIAIRRQRWLASQQSNGQQQ